MKKSSRLKKMLKHSRGSSTQRFNAGGIEKRGNYRPKAVTLPTLESARKITEGKDTE